MPSEIQLSQQAEAELAERREGIDLSPKPILWVGLGTLVFLLVSMAGLLFYYRWAATPINDPPPPARFPAPRLQSDPAGDLVIFRQEQQRGREGYAWINGEGGFLRIPVDRAMEILGTRGARGYDPLEAPDPAIPLPVRPEAARP
ncbi:hypothetical protein [Roseomonas elaeocarpi]|uniref:Uncharacterized protein n=1 Tax=Roseomonas elaeocarpi TaxID=907779 RepID=A0ABV6JY71_9PROT